LRIAITGGTGFVGRHLAERYPAADVVLISRRTGIDTADAEALVTAFEGCEVVVHCAGINREIGDQTYAKVHVQGTQAVVDAARRAGVRKVILLSFLRARPACGSRYHESKWAAEEVVRGSGLDYTVLKAGMIYGPGDHLLDHLSHTAYTFPVFPAVGLREKSIRPVPIDEFTDLLVAAVGGRMTRETVAVTGGEELTMSEAMRRVAKVVGRRVFVVRAPYWFHVIVAQIAEWTMTVPLLAKAQARMLAEGVAESAPPTPGPPDDLVPRQPFSAERIKSWLPERGGFGFRDLRWSRAA
jgi:uncharacterized protein YbjT (DUF2867 family)